MGGSSHSENGCDAHHGAHDDITLVGQVFFAQGGLWIEAGGAGDFTASALCIGMGWGNRFDWNLRRENGGNFEGRVCREAVFFSQVNADHAGQGINAGLGQIGNADLGRIHASTGTGGDYDWDSIFFAGDNQCAFVAKLIDRVDHKIDRLAVVGFRVEQSRQGVRIDVFEERTDFCPRRDLLQAFSDNLDFWTVDGVFQCRHLPIDGRQGNPVHVDQGYATDTGSDKGFASPRPNPSHPGHQDMRIVKPAHAVFPDQTAKSLKSPVNVSVYEHRMPTLNRMPVFTQGISGLFRSPFMRSKKKFHSTGLIGLALALLSAACSQEYTVTGKALPADSAGGADSAGSPSPGSSAATSSNSSGNPTTVPPSDNATTRQRIQFTGSKSDQVPGYLWVPANRGQKKLPGLIFMYGITGNKDDGGVAEAARILAAANFVVMTIDWPGTGERLPAISKADRATKADVMKWTVSDYGAALTWLAARPEVRSDRLGYAGASMGAMTGIVFTKGDARVKAMVAMVPLPNPLWGLSAPESAIGGISPRPLLCIMADGDPLGRSVCDNAGANAEKKNFPGQHELTNSRQAAATAARDFFIRHLGN